MLSFRRNRFPVAIAAVLVLIITFYQVQHQVFLDDEKQVRNIFFGTNKLSKTNVFLGCERWKWKPAIAVLQKDLYSLILPGF